MTRQQAMLGWVLGSAALMLLGAFGPWVKALGTSVSGTDGGNDGWIVVVAAVAAAGLFYHRRELSAAGIWPVIGGVIGAIVTLYDRNNISDALDEGGAFAQAIAQVGWGLNLAVIASISFAVSGVVWWRKHDEIFPVEDMATDGTPAVPAHPSTAASPAPPIDAAAGAVTAARADAPAAEPPVSLGVATAADGDQADAPAEAEMPNAPKTDAVQDPAGIASASASTDTQDNPDRPQ